jgi:outer membrane murein-binding lipoprotein Lpp
MQSIKRVYAALDEVKDPSGFASQCEAIVGKLTNNQDVPNPVPALTVVTGHIAGLRQSITDAIDGPKGAAQNRNVALGQLRSDMRQIKAAVQAAADANLGRAAAIIENAGFRVSKRAPKVKPPIAVRYGKVPGLAILDAKAPARKATYFWSMSTDQKIWSDLPQTLKSRTTVSGLTAATIYYFRVRTLTAAGMSEWSMVATYVAQ